MKVTRSQLKSLIKEVASSINELAGEKPEIGQYRWNYEISVTIKTPFGDTYDRTDTSKWWHILAKDEAEAKEKAIAPYNPKVVTIHKVKMIKGKPVDQSDIDQYNKMVAGYAHALRPKDQGGWGADEGVINEASKGNYIQALRKVKSLIDQSPEKKSLKALIKNYDGEPMLELRAYGLPMGDNHGFVELQDEFGRIVEALTDDHWEVAEVDEAAVGGKQFKYALFTFPQSGKMPGDDSNVSSLIDMGRESVMKEGKVKKGQLLTEGAFTISPEQKKFADEIIDAAVNKTRGREPMLQDLEAIRTVIKFKLAQEGWRKSGSSSSTPKEPWPPMPKDVRNVDPTDIKL